MGINIEKRLTKRKGEMIMANIFDYATKELSQDAFLRWLFENYLCENSNVKNLALKLLADFTDMSIQDGDINNLNTYAQYPKKIDILVKFEKENSLYVIAIEDKTYSKEHNQLPTYNEELNKYIDKCKKEHTGEVKLYKIFYKTYVENDWDIQACEEYGWKPYFIDKICKLFEGYDSTNSEILDSYTSHIMHIKSCLNDYDKKPVSEWERIEFRGCFEHIVKETVKKYGDDYWIKNGFFPDWYAYESIMLKKVVTGTPFGLSIEIVARETCFTALIRAWKNDEVTKKGKSVPEEIQIDDKNIIELMQSTVERMDKSKRFRRYNSKWAINNSSNILDQKLSYENTYSSLNAELNETIAFFADLINELTIVMAKK